MKLNILVSAAVALVVTLGGSFFSSDGGNPLGGQTVTNRETHTDGLVIDDGVLQITGDGIKVGSSGTTVNKMITGTCNLSTGQLGLEATSSDFFHCAVTGVAAGDNVSVTLPKNGAGWGGFVVNSASASTTGWIDVEIGNYTGAATSSFIQATTSVFYRVTDD